LLSRAVLAGVIANRAAVAAVLIYLAHLFSLQKEPPTQLLLAVVVAVVELIQARVGMADNQSLLHLFVMGAVALVHTKITV
jgi:hypothetical protein